MTQGFPVLAYPSCDNATPVSLFLVFACNESCAQFTLCLLSSLHQGNENQNIILQYDASNIVPGAVSLGPATIPLPQLRLKTLARGGNPQIRTLSLRLHKLCPVWCPPSFVSAKEALDQHMIQLVKTTELEIVFDYNWLHRQHHSLFHRFIEQPETLSGFPVDRRYRRLRYEQIDWAKLSEGTSRAQESVFPGVEDGDLPPGYAEASGKRARQVSTSPAPISPPRKRVLLSPYEDAPNSPTEKASTATPSPQRLPPATPSPGFPRLADISPIPPNLASTKYDAVSPSAKPATPITAPSNLGHAISQTVSTLLPDVLSSLLPSLLPRLLAQSPTPSSQSSLASEISHAPSLPRLSALGISLTDRVIAKMERETDLLYKHTLSHANFLRAAADDKFVDMLEEERLALERAAESKYSEFQERVEGVVDKVVGRVEDEAGVIEDKVIERLEGRAENVGRDVEELKKERVFLEREKETLRRDVEALRADKEELKRDKSELRHDKEELRREIGSLRIERDRLRRGQVQPEYAHTQPSMRDSSTDVESREGSVLA